MFATVPAGARRGLRRRSVLFGVPGTLAGAALVAGCTDDGSAEGSAARERSAGERALERAVRDSKGLLTQYEAVAAAHPALGEQVAPLRAHVEQHVAAFGAAGGKPSASPSGAAAGPDGTPSPGASSRAPAPPRVPPTEREALAWLAAAERTVAARRTDALPGVPGATARLLASAAAAGSAHAYLLTERAS